MKNFLRQKTIIYHTLIAIAATLTSLTTNALVIRKPYVDDFFQSHPGFDWGRQAGKVSVDVCWQNVNNKPKTGDWGPTHYSTDGALQHALDEWNSHMGNTVKLNYRNNSCKNISGLTGYYVKITNNGTNSQDMKTSHDGDHATIYVCDVNKGAYCDWCADSNDSNCIDAQGYFTHELGHVLGAREEHDRTDAACPDSPHTDNVLRNLTRYVTSDDSCYSTMSYKTKDKGENNTKERYAWRTITTKDARGMRTFWGNRANAAWANRSVVTAPNGNFDISVGEGNHTLGYGALQYSTSLKPRNVSYHALSFSSDANDRQLLINISGIIPIDFDAQAFPICILSKEADDRGFPILESCQTPNSHSPQISFTLTIPSGIKMDYWIEVNTSGASDYDFNGSYHVQ
ncbi:hypothetical protein ACNKU7_04550 [Microbulbifer sp. SA54]|uniref:hypothetical protein n=1 Tax=Microbulbifer sp. SA54 TaxID=3401577 RepID=UPI003AB0A915